MATVASPWVEARRRQRLSRETTLERMPQATTPWATQTAESTPTAREQILLEARRPGQAISFLEISRKAFPWVTPGQTLTPSRAIFLAQRRMVSARWAISCTTLIFPTPPATTLSAARPRLGIIASHLYKTLFMTEC